MKWEFRMGKICFKSREIKQGVLPDLGPILFLLQTNDLPVNIQKAKIVLFADDTC
jgi:hypothetical protein